MQAFNAKNICVSLDVDLQAFNAKTLSVSLDVDLGCASKCPSHSFCFLSTRFEQVKGEL